MLDYKAETLWKNGRKVDSLRVAGLLAEVALKASTRSGLSALTTGDLPSCVDMNLDGRRGQREVQAYEADRVLAVNVARAVRVRLHKFGFELMDVVSRGGGGQRDMVLEVVDPELSGGCQLKRISCELRCRRLWSQAGRLTVRSACQTECVDQCDWWLREAVTGKWSGRLVVLAEFPQSGDDFALRADYTPVGGKSRGLFGWPGSRGTLAPTLPQPAALPRAPGLSRAAAAKSKPWAATRSALKFRIEQGKRVAPVAAALVNRGLDSNHLWRDVPRWKRRYPEGEAFQVQRVSRKGGKKHPGP